MSAEVDLTLGPVELMAQIKASIDGLRSDVRKLWDQERRYQLGVRTVKYGGSGNSGASALLTPVDCGGPQYGRKWEIRTVYVGGVLWTTTAGGNGLLLVSPAQPQTPTSATTGPQGADIVWETAMPATDQWSGRQITIRHPNRLWFAVVGTLTGTTEYVCSGFADDIPDATAHPIVETI